MTVSVLFKFGNSTGKSVIRYPSFNHQDLCSDGALSCKKTVKIREPKQRSKDEKNARNRPTQPGKSPALALLKKIEQLVSLAAMNDGGTKRGEGMALISV
jgi:hypothetical protein